MTLRISGKSISVGDALRSRVSERTDEVLRKYFDGNYSGHITLSKDGFGFRTDCALHLDSGITLEAEFQRRRCLCQRRPGAADDREAAAPLQEPAEGSLGPQDLRRQALAS